ncbi:hypothetical protein TMatcc_009922 [Talaromyces marneffei ATCC 18224]|uniref:Asteroid domain-containing protein n=1 Tax=Talaromyces marneffei (strain ATCC 18224 / CBS 334.59 / QM 7333) TaxID=441960 RepID=B6QTN7_TALMQ|nr:conserved hypothetical protein [Talaromyces marneffei ATCC 18224]
MGIPYLTRHLASFSESTLLGTSQDSSCKAIKSVVIDGPGLVHYVHSVLLSQASSSLSQVERQPSCNEVSVAFMTYLVILQTSGVNILRIYFDGALPLNKRDTRLSRLEASRKQLEIFCLSHREGFKWSPIEQRPALIDPVRFLQDSHTSLKRPLLPGNPFMVSAVVEDLKSRWTHSEMSLYLPRNLIDIYKANNNQYHPWSDITEIITGEADVFCAALASQNPGAAILTSDSDLLLFDIGPESTIIFFDTIRVEDAGNKIVPTELPMTIKAMKYHPPSIADRLGIPALSYLAHELNQSPRSKLAELVRRAKIASDLTPKTSAYVSFLEEYDLQNFLQYDPSEAHALQNLDTRISELFVQCLWTNNNFQDQRQALHIYLPFLVEDHSRKCAWAESVEFRRLAYSLLNLNGALTTGSRLTAVIECVRRGRRLCLDNIDLYSIGEEVERESASLLDGLESFQRQYHLRHQHANYGSPLFWRTYALYEIHRDWFTTNNQPSPFKNHVALKSFLGLSRGTEYDTFDNETIEWDDIHSLAQLQAVLYSLRMVYQILQGLAQDQRGGSLARLCDILAQLPSLQVLMRSFHEVRRELYGFEPTLVTDTRCSS